MDSDGDEKPQLIAQFCSVTGVESDRAKFYLESSAWKINVALAAFYDNQDDDNFEPEIIEPELEEIPQEPVANPETSEQVKKEKKKTASSRFATLQTIGSDDSSPEEEGQAFYTGGSERSGQQVLGPPKKKSTDFIKEMFKSAASHGAQEVHDTTSEDQKGHSSGFHGAGFRLGASSNDSEMVQSSSSSRRRQQVHTVLKLWENGFSINEGPLRNYQDPANKEFFDSIRQGEIPQELIDEAQGGEVNLNMEDHRTEEYKLKKKKVEAFSGAGHVLGSPAAEVTTPKTEISNSKSAGQSSFTVDDSKPTTNIQLRLADGSRIVLKMNHDNTIQDIRNHIISTHPEFKFSHFILMTTFPNKELTDDSQTVAEANLLNAVIVQRIQS